jgi:uncharacterized protein (DUF488 family)
MTLYTIGHGTRPIADFIDILRAHGVERVTDVRAFPGSRTNPQFGKERLAVDLPAAGIEYEHAPALGGRRRGLGETSPNTAWQHPAFRGYADYMMTGDFQDALRDLLKTSIKVKTAIMCSETLWWRCHRRMIADAATASGANVLHIMNIKNPAPHRLTPFARISGDTVTYVEERL